VGADVFSTTQGIFEMNPRVYSSIALASIAWFVASLTALHFLRADVSPLARGISHYANGAYDSILALSLFAVGIGGFAVVLGLTRELVPAARSVTGLVLLGLWAVAQPVGAVFRIDAPGAIPTLAGTIHSLAGLSFLAAVFGTLLVSRRLSADARWVSFAPSAVLLAWGGVAAAVVLYILIEPLAGLGLGGLAQRGFWALTLIWFAATALHLGSQHEARGVLAGHPA
jgi:hypothetical protein